MDRERARKRIRLLYKDDPHLLGECMARLWRLTEEEYRDWATVCEQQSERYFVTVLLGGAAAGPGPAAVDADCSAELGKKLLEPVLEVPPALDALRDFLAKPPAAQIPITAAALSLLRLRPDLQQWFTVATGELANAIGNSLSALLIFGPAEMWTAMAENTVIVTPLMTLDTVLPADVRLGLKAERDQVDSTSLMTVTSGGASLMSDGILRDNGGLRMLAKWEDRAADMLAAVDDLHRKTAVWRQLYYGDIEYLPCFAAAGSELQFYAISRANGQTQQPRPVSAILQLTSQNDRAQALITTINFYRLLRAQRLRYPGSVLRAGLEMSGRHPSAGFTRSSLLRTDELAVRKRLFPWSSFARWSGVVFEDLRELYRATSQRQGLVHALNDEPTMEADKYSVDLVPVGLQSNNALPSSEDEARHMVHGLLHGLAAIHEAGFVHRDLRWDNVACHPVGHRWFLLDLETCTRADQQPKASFQPVGWEPGTTLVRGLYTSASDLYQLGLIVKGKCQHLIVSEAGKAFLKIILTPPVDQKLSTAKLLSNEWLRCEGSSCSSAGAQPGER